LLRGGRWRFAENRISVNARDRLSTHPGERLQSLELLSGFKNAMNNLLPISQSVVFFILIFVFLYFVSDFDICA